MLRRILQTARGRPTLIAKNKHLGGISQKELGRNQQNLLRCFPLKAEDFGFLHENSLSLKDKENHNVKNNNNNPGFSRLDATPSDFHHELCQMITNAKERVLLASLYIGTGSSPSSSLSSSSKISKEDKFLEAIEIGASRVPKFKVLLDSSRALRPIRHDNSKSDKNVQTTTCSAKAVYNKLKGKNASNYSINTNYPNTEKELFLFNIHDFPMSHILPSPLDEVAGVFHLKAYIIDDNLILSGANLSEEYFSDRRDRYMHFRHGAGGLVDFYADLIDVMCKYSDPYSSSGNHLDGNNKVSSLSLSYFITRNKEKKNRKENMLQELSLLFENEKNKEDALPDSDDFLAYAIPTLQMPSNFSKEKIPSPDTEIFANLCKTILNEHKHLASIRISSAYLNPTPTLLNVLKEFGMSFSSSDNTEKEGMSDNTNSGSAFLMSAGPKSHGFAPKKKKDPSAPNRQFIPAAYSYLTEYISQYIQGCGGQILLYENEGWTFHSKGAWISYNKNDIIKSSEKESEIKKSETDQKREQLLSIEKDVLQVAVIGSGNYGSRSEELDVESNCILVLRPPTNPDGIRLQQELMYEWNSMCSFCNPTGDTTNNKIHDGGSGMNEILFQRVVVPMIKKYL